MPEQDVNSPHLTVLFWNVCRESETPQSYIPNPREERQKGKRAQRIVEAISDMACEHDTDLLIFAELQLPSQVIVEALVERTGFAYTEAKADQCTKVRIFIKPTIQECLSIYGAGDTRYTMRHVFVRGQQSLLLVAAHFKAQGMAWKPEDQLSYLSSEVAPTILLTERNLQHARTIMVGDLNLNPYDAGITSAYALHAVMTRSLASKNRTIHGKVFKRFYNPMWTCFRTVKEGTPSGTFYYDSGPSTHYWNIFDQVLLRPALLDCFEESSLHILTKAGTKKLISKEGVPLRNIFSDHLPILFKLRLMKEPFDDNL